MSIYFDKEIQYIFIKFRHHSRHLSCFKEKLTLLYHVNLESIFKGLINPMPIPSKIDFKQSLI